MRKGSELLLSWREPWKTARARLRVDAWARRAGIVAAILLPISTPWFIALVPSVRDRSAAVSVYPVFLLFACSLTVATIWIASGVPKRVRLIRRDAPAAPRRGDALAWGIARHARCPTYRVLMMLYADGRKSLFGIADDVSDDELREAWSRSEMAAVPLQSTDALIPANEPRSDPGQTIFKWPNSPSYWPLAHGNRGKFLRRLGWIFILPPLATAVGWPVVFALQRSAYTRMQFGPMSDYYVNAIVWSLTGSIVFAVIVALAAVTVMPLAGMVFGWNSRTVRAGAKGLCFAGHLGRGVCFPWPKVKALVIRLSPYASVWQEIAVIYDYYGMEAVYIRTVSRHFDYEAFVKALAEVTDAAPEAAETPEGLTIRLTGFAGKAKGAGYIGPGGRDA